ncbi:MAG: hypothetical protein LBJ87_13935 [bacterium]|nr:hypothetical protein [bacterium]
MDLSPDWLNDGVKGFLPGAIDPEASVFVDEPGLRVLVASPRYVLGMKVAAARVADDAGDIRLLADHLGLKSSREVLDVAVNLYEGTGLQFPPRTRFLVEEMFGSASPPDTARGRGGEPNTVPDPGRPELNQRRPGQEGPTAGPMQPPRAASRRNRVISRPWVSPGRDMRERGQ